MIEGLLYYFAAFGALTHVVALVVVLYMKWLAR